jgi:predicted DNA-binding transcriptional regulator YafY
MRADRLVATLLLMQARGRVTAAEVAGELEVSVATARRDLEALSTAGIPVYPQPGRGGGWSLVGGARTDLTGLTAAEAQALFRLVGASSDRSAEATSALRKLVRALPETFRAQAEAAARAVLVDPVGWGSPARVRQPWVEELQDAVVRRRQVTLGYLGRGGSSERVVDPWALVDKGDRWYLVAGTPAGRRTFRLDRIVHVAVGDSPGMRPDDLDVAGIWDSVVEQVEQWRSRVTATVLTPPLLARVVRSQFGRHVIELGTERDGRVRLEVGSHTARSVAEHLAGLGAGVEVVEPAAVRAELAAIGAELVAMSAGVASVPRMITEGTFTVSGFTGVPIDVEQPVVTALPVGVATMVKTYVGGVEGRSTTLFTSAFDPGSGVGTYVAMESFEGSLDGRAGTFNFVHVASTRGTDRADEYFSIVPFSGTGELAGITGGGVLAVDEDGTHRMRFDYTVA